MSANLFILGKIDGIFAFVFYANILCRNIRCLRRDNCDLYLTLLDKDLHQCLHGGCVSLGIVAHLNKVGKHLPALTFTKGG